MDHRKKLFLILLCLLLISGIPLLAKRLPRKGTPRIGVSTNRAFYQVGETVKVTLDVSPGGPRDVFLVVTTPVGKRLYADPAFQFRHQAVAVARGIYLPDRKVEFPVSLATRDLSKDGQYTIEAYLAPPGGGTESWMLSGETEFIVSLPGLNFLAIHDPTSTRYLDNCASCHQDKTRHVSLAPGVQSFHSLKYQLFGGDTVPRNCTYCHVGADLLQGSEASLRKQVPPDFCNMCHSAFGPGKKLFDKPTPLP